MKYLQKEVKMNRILRLAYSHVFPDSLTPAQKGWVANVEDASRDYSGFGGRILMGFTPDKSGWRRMKKNGWIELYGPKNRANRNSQGATSDFVKMFPVGNWWNGLGFRRGANIFRGMRFYLKDGSCVDLLDIDRIELSQRQK